MSNKLEHLQLALSLTEQMLIAARSEKWSEIADLQLKRTPLFEQVFPLSDADNNDATRTVLEKIINVNQQVEALCRDARQVIQTELNGLNKNKKAAAAYQAS